MLIALHATTLFIIWAAMLEENVPLDVSKYKRANIQAQRDTQAPARHDSTFADDTVFLMLVKDNVRNGNTVCKLAKAMYPRLVQRGLSPSSDASELQISAATGVPASFVATTEVYETLGAKVHAQEADVAIAPVQNQTLWRGGLSSTTRRGRRCVVDGYKQHEQRHHRNDRFFSEERCLPEHSRGWWIPLPCPN